MCGRLFVYRTGVLAIMFLLVSSSTPIPMQAIDRGEASAVRGSEVSSISFNLKGQDTTASQAVDMDWWSSVQEDIRHSEYQVTWQERTYLNDVPAAYQAPNRANNLRTYFVPTGAIVIPRVGIEPGERLPWRWEVSLAAWGRASTMAALPDASLETHENRIDYRLGEDLVEWYRNDEDGLVQGITFLNPDPGRQLGELLRVELAVGGDLVPEVTKEGAGIVFRAGEDKAVLCYGALQVADAEGRQLPASLSLNGSTLSILIEDADAIYPVELEATISGLLSTDDWTLTFGEAGAAFGTSLATAGDVDGDGYSEVIVGAPSYDGGLVDQGGVFVYYGSPGGLYGWSDWIKTIDQAGAHFGDAVASAGDVNGDGFADVIVGAPDYTNGEDNEGGMWVWLGSANGLENSWSKRAEGNQPGAAFGASVSTAGDVNGDGYADVIVGAPLYENGQGEEGMVWVWHGSAEGLGSWAWRAESNQYQASLGQSVATAGDINGDGYSDVIVGATRYDATEEDEGAAFVWLGSVDGLNGGVNGNPVNAHRHLQINSIVARFGWSVSTAGDVNGDGYCDVIVGAPYYTNGQGQEGGAWLYLGSADGLNATASNQDEGNQANAHFGWSVGTAGDVNGDGRADVIVGAPGYTVSLDQQGQAFIWHGQATSTGISATRDWDAVGEQTGASFGSSVFTAGDVNGDGYSDVIVGAPGHASEAGRAYVYHGAPGPLAEEAGWTKASNMASAWFGLSVGTAGDVNGDGYADVIVGSPGWDGGLENQGQAWVYMGQNTGLSTVPAWYKASNNEMAQFGYSVGTAGDVNGDGYDDVIVGAPYWHNPEIDEGAAFVYAGSADGLDKNVGPIWSKASNQVGAKFGTSVGTAGDVNGDGYMDIIIGAPFWQRSNNERGAVWLYYGSNTGPHVTPDWYTVGDQDNAEYGLAVGTAGDVNRDGYSDVIVGSPLWEDDNTNEGRAWVYLGSSSGLRYDVHWHAEGNNFGAKMGSAVGTAGDVDGDGYADVIVGAPGYGDDGLEGEGKVWVFHGSNQGLEMGSSWSREGGQNSAHYGSSVGTAGDVNGDGYADVIIGIELWSGGLLYEGGASVYHGSPSGLELSWAWHGEGEQTSAHYGTSVGSAGDVNGDGYADVIVGAPNYQTSSELLDEGQAFLYYGNGGRGVSVRPRQLQRESSAPIARLGIARWFGEIPVPGFSMSWFMLSPFGRGTMRVETEVKNSAQPFNSTQVIRGASYRRTIPGTQITVDRTGLTPGLPYHWRIRTCYGPDSIPWMPCGRWVTMPWNGWNEQDLRIQGSVIYLPVILRD